MHLCSGTMRLLSRWGYQPEIGTVTRHTWFHALKIVKIARGSKIARRNETYRLRVMVALTGSLCAAFARRYAVCAAHGVSMPSPYAQLTA